MPQWERPFRLQFNFSKNDDRLDLEPGRIFRSSIGQFNPETILRQIATCGQNDC